MRRRRERQLAHTDQPHSRSAPVRFGVQAAMLAALLASGAPLEAQITTTLGSGSDGTTEIKLRNDSTLTLAAFALSVNYIGDRSAGTDPIVLWIDPALQSFPLIKGPRNAVEEARPLKPQEEYTWWPGLMMWEARNPGPDKFKQPIFAGIFADGSTTGNAALLTRLLDRRNNMLLAVEVTLETLMDVAKYNTGRDQLIDRFRMMADSTRRWYLPPEQQVGLGLYRSMIGKLMNLRDGQVGSLSAQGSFLERETQRLNRQRVELSALLNLQTDPTDWARLGG